MTPANIHELSVEDRVLCDDGFTCVAPWSIVTILQDEAGMYFECDEGKHYLDGQLGEGGTLVGLFVPMSHERRNIETSVCSAHWAMLADDDPMSWGTYE